MDGLKLSDANQLRRFRIVRDVKKDRLFGAKLFLETSDAKKENMEEGGFIESKKREMMNKGEIQDDAAKNRLDRLFSSVKSYH